MNLDELRSVQNKERQKDSLQHLRESFYEDVAAYVEELEADRDRLAEEAEDPFASPEVRQLTDEIETAKDVTQAIYERRLGKLVKRASLAAAGMHADEEGLTVEESELFSDLVDRIERNKSHVLDVLEGETDESSVSAVSGGGDAASTAGSEPLESAEDGRARDAGDGRAREAKTGRMPDAEDGQARDAGDGRMPDAGDGQARDAGDGRAREAGDGPSPETDVGEFRDAEDGQSQETDVGGSQRSGDDQFGDGGAVPSEDAGGGQAGDATDRESVAAAEAANVAGPPSGEEPLAGERGDDGTARGAPGEDAVSAAEPGVEGDRPDRGLDDRTTVRITSDVGEIFGVDEREYDLTPETVVTLPAENAEPLLQRGAAERIRPDE